MEQKEYKEEGITWETITFKDNKPILDLFLAKPFGIFSLLDEQSAFPKATDTNFVDKLNSNFKGKPHFEIVRSHNPMFTVVHYAGKVQYNASGFLEKNRDTIPANIRGLFINSVTPLLSVLFAATISRTGTLMPQRRAKHSLAVLMEKMFAANPHFIRCIKPNASKQPDLLDSKVVMDQIMEHLLLNFFRAQKVNSTPDTVLETDLQGIMQSCLCILNNTDLKDWKCGGKDRCRHYMIEMQTNGKYVILGEARAHPSLLDLIEYHKTVGVLPFLELLTVPCGQRSNAEPDYEELKKLMLIPSSLAAEEHSEPSEHSSSDPVHLELLKLFAPLDQNQTMERQVPPVLKKISEKKLKTEAKESQRNCSEDHKESSNRRHFPRLYPSIRLAMREIQQIQQVRGKDRCRHYMIEMQTNGKYVILGEARAHPSLLDLIEYHKTVGVLPFLELLTVPCGQRSNAEPDYEDLKNLMLIPSSLAAEKDSEPSEHSSSDPVHLELLKLFAPLDQNQTMERQVPPVLKKISEKKLKTEAKESQRNCSEDHEESSNRRPFPRLYPSIRLAMREIQQVQQVRNHFAFESCFLLIHKQLF
ncbi:UNVERIFIED_CONTAM: hypothetical protein FKN15_043897 [Acipenser sinensis]